MEGEAGMRRWQGSVGVALRATLGVLALTVALVACGKVGPVRPPGPPDEITHPRQYPNR
jgi:predicted small lipoprotein YifL